MTNPGYQYKFDNFLLDSQNGFLLQNKKLVPLNWRAFKVLELLVQNQGRVVPKKDFMETVWKDSFVEEGSLAVAINSIRKVLHKDGNKLIETFSRRGYRFSGKVERVAVRYEPIQKQESLTFPPKSDSRENFENQNIKDLGQPNTLYKFFGFFSSLTKKH